MIPASEALQKVFKKKDFPATRQELLKRYPQKQIYLSANQPSNLADVLSRLPRDRFETLDELAKVIDESIIRY